MKYKATLDAVEGKISFDSINDGFIRPGMVFALWDGFYMITENKKDLYYRAVNLGTGKEVGSTFLLHTSSFRLFQGEIEFKGKLIKPIYEEDGDSE